ncbi:MAG: tRNA(5-methylaminomethyl-2-thiouridylate) methyltransferase [Desulfovibrionaceae bacterium]|nr:tRNA(5-methylaminomethyl-2-thiouridylate) methyltransferase [Desulfovibrionaceae bacterium]
MVKPYHALALFSGGLDSILACRLIQAQGLAVLGLHFTSPFFGRPRKVGRWRKAYGLDIEAVDLGDEFSALLAAGPRHGFGKLLNPCVDCKILMLSRARDLLGQYGASFIVSGEVTGQRPMSQRRDSLYLISREAGVRDILVRPLCAKRLNPTAVEASGLVDRERLLDIGGRGRKRQLALARDLGLTETPTPAGGCELAEPESARRFLPVLRHLPAPRADDFRLCRVGRQFWSGGRWLVIGRNKADNLRMEALVRPGDILLRVRDFPGPLALARAVGPGQWDREAVRDAAAFTASYSGRAVQAAGPVEVLVTGPGGPEAVSVLPGRETPLAWAEPDLSGLKDWKQELAHGA